MTSANLSKNSLLTVRAQMNDDILMHVIVHGHVQGVFFRATTRNHAHTIGIVGTVKNLPDGTVEIWAQGSKEPLNNFLQKLKDEPGMGAISHFETDYPQSNQSFDGFNVIY
jgi:acylphosphatase